MKIKKRILISILLILIILSTNIAVTLAATKSELQNKQNNINQQIKDTENDIPVDMLEIHLRSAFDNLGILIGDTYEDELIDKLVKSIQGRTHCFM